MSAYHQFKEELSGEISRLGRNPSDVRLIAVSKYADTNSIRRLFAEGQRDFAENYLQDALPKMRALSDLPITWHGIGHIQSNKAKKFAETFPLLHSVDNLKLAERLNRHGEEQQKPPSIFLQVNVAEEKSKSGFSKDSLIREFEKILPLKHLDILGLMTLAPHFDDPEQTRSVFRALRELRDALNSRFGTHMKHLSMGMSADWKQALAEGATHLRVGRALFD